MPAMVSAMLDHNTRNPPEDGEKSINERANSGQINSLSRGVLTVSPMPRRGVAPRPVFSMKYKGLRTNTFA